MQAENGAFLKGTPVAGDIPGRPVFPSHPSWLRKRASPTRFALPAALKQKSSFVLEDSGLKAD